MQRLIENEGLRDRLAAGALEHARSFSWERTADATLDVYHRARETMAAWV
jgi:D-inositol-3-phosphate glycosyltransferase